MARLIGADELKTAFPPGEYVRTECVRATIDAAPTVQAIPVEWIEWRIAHAEREGFGATVSMLRTVRDWWNDQRDVWEMEQEAK